MRGATDLCTSITDPLRVSIHAPRAGRDFFLDVPRSCIIWNVGAALLILLTFGLSYWYLLSINLIVHFGVRYFSVEDPQFFECFSRYWTKRDYYST